MAGWADRAADGAAAGRGGHRTADGVWAARAARAALASLGLTVGFTTAAVVLAQVFVAAPFYVRAARVGFQGVDRELEEMAATLGGSSWTIFWRVTVPLAFPRC